MSIVALHFLWIFLAPALAAEPRPPIETECTSSVEKVLRTWKEKPQAWSQELSLNPEMVLYRAPTTQVGTSLLFTHYKGELISLSRITPHSALTIAYDAHDCTARVELEQIPQVESAPLPSQFTNESLQKILDESRAKGTSGFIYIWSPRMLLSLRGLNELKHVAAEFNLKAIYLADPISSDTEIKTMARKGGLEIPKQYRFASPELNLRGGLIHFPTLLLFSKGEILPKILPGYVGEFKYREYIVRGLKL